MLSKLVRNIAILKNHVTISWQRLPLTKKLILCYIFILAIPLTFYSVYTFHKIAETTKADFIKSQVQNLKETKFHIYRNIEICQRAAQFVIDSKELMKFISDSKEENAQEFIEFKNVFLTQIERLLYTNPDLYRLRFFINNYKFPEIWPLIYHDKRISHEKWYTSTQNWENEVYWQLDHIFQVFNIASSERSKVVSMYRKVWYPANQYLGIIEISMLVNEFFGNTYVDEKSSDSGFAVLQGNNKIFFYGNSFLEQIGIGIDDLKLLLLNQTDAQEGICTLEINRKPIIVVYTTIEPLRSVIYKIVSIENVINNIKRTRNLLILTTVGGFLALSIVTYVFTSAILQKMRIIINSMRKIQEGDLDVDIPVYGFDEIAELARCFRKMLEKIKELISTVVRKELITKETELKALHSQINAHFIYNVLESIKMMSEIDGNFEIADALTSLGKLMRYSISWKRDHVPLGYELDYIDNYIKLLNIRWDFNISYIVDIPKELQNCEICKMSIQPLVENAVIHGIQPRGQDGIVKVSGWKEEECVVIEVYDNGKGIEKNTLEKLRCAISTESGGNDLNNQLTTGIGLINVNERIKLSYGNQYGIEIDSVEDVFTKVRLKFPCIKSFYFRSEELGGRNKLL